MSRRAELEPPTFWRVRAGAAAAATYDAAHLVRRMVEAAPTAMARAALLEAQGRLTDEAERLERVAEDARWNP